jgi:hypothetical protein
VPAALQVIGVPRGLGRAARLAIRRKEVVVGHGRGRRDSAQVVEHAAFEVYERADDVERENLEVLQRHVEIPLV